MKIEKVNVAAAPSSHNPYAEIASALIRGNGGEILVTSEGAFPPLSEEALAAKIQHEWGKQPGRVKVQIADNSRSPERYRIRVEYDGEGL